MTSSNNKIQLSLIGNIEQNKFLSIHLYLI